MAITDKEEGVWGLDQVYNKINQGGIWSYSSTGISQRMYMWGSNSYGLFLAGEPTNTRRSSPVQIPGDTWTTISMNSGGTCKAIKVDGTGWAWGYNFYGNVGVNDKTTYSSPKQIPGTNWRSMGVAGSHTEMGTKTDGTLWMWGWNRYGQLGQNSAGNPGPSPAGRLNSQSSPVQVLGTDWDKINSTKALYGNVAMIGACTKTDGTLWLWGNNENKQLGQGNTTDYSSPVQVSGSWKKVVVGEECIMAQKTDGTLWSWGHNEGGVMGINAPAPASYDEPQAVGTDTTWRDFDFSFVGTSAFATKTDGTLWSWGYNGLGALGRNNISPARYSSPVQVPGTTWASVGGSRDGAMVTKTDGTLWIWGKNNNGQLGTNEPTTIQRKSSPTQIGSATGWTVEADSPYHWTLAGGPSNVNAALSDTSQ